MNFILTNIQSFIMTKVSKEWLFFITLAIPVGISEKGWVIACSGRWYTDLVFLIQSNI